MWTPPWHGPWWRDSLRPARTSSGSARSIRWAKDSTAPKPTGRRPSLSTVSFLHVFCPSLLFFYTHAWSITGLLCPITLWSAADHQDCHCLSVFSVTDRPPTVLSKSCCSWKHNTVGFLSQVVSGRLLLSPLALISWLSLACSCGRQTPHSQRLLLSFICSKRGKHAVSVPGEKKVVWSLTLSNNDSLLLSWVLRTVFRDRYIAA